MINSLSSTWILPIWSEASHQTHQTICIVYSSHISKFQVLMKANCCCLSCLVNSAELNLTSFFALFVALYSAVHGAMAGMSSFLVGSINTRECYVPIELVVNKRNVIDTSHQSLWEYVVFSTGQPSFQTNQDGQNEEDVITTASGGVILSTN